MPPAFVWDYCHIGPTCSLDKSRFGHWIEKEYALSLKALRFCDILDVAPMLIGGTLEEQYSVGMGFRPTFHQILQAAVWREISEEKKNCFTLCVVVVVNCRRVPGRWKFGFSQVPFVRRTAPRSCVGTPDKRIQTRPSSHPGRGKPLGPGSVSGSGSISYKTSVDMEKLESSWAS